ncbi:ChaN family lipoprotein [Acidovorax sp. BL-A-41-H1]|uniref:ChaN family lipoprotein n=1 Tax=Acidovorax sp. BL-A-41-H1 TaxID=3421102 RepID=UPI003F79476E
MQTPGLPIAALWRAPVAKTLLALGALAGLATLTGCAANPATDTTAGAAPGWGRHVDALLPADVLLLGEQHDATEHQRLQRDTVQRLAERGQLAAVVMEMAEHGHGTAGLPASATPDQARAALQWNDAAWPWQAYGPVVMAAVQAGVPVLGGNLPRSSMRAAMQDTAWDAHLPAAALQRQYTALREGHCGLLPESQIAPMARIQLARDASMAQTVQGALQPGKTVVLIAGAGHVHRSMGVPTHWPASVRAQVVVARAGAGAPVPEPGDADAVLETAAAPARDACAELRQQWQARPAAQPAAGARP